MSKYWRKRIDEEMTHKQQQDTQIGDELKRLHDYHMSQIEKEIQAFYQRYAVNNQISVADAKKLADRMDVQAFAEKAKRYVEEKNFSPQANAELALYNLKMKVSRLELLQYNMDLEMLALADGEHKMTEKFLNREFVDEMNFQAGILGEIVASPKSIAGMAQGIINTPYHGATWSANVWKRQNALRVIVARMAEDTLLRGRNALNMIPQLRKEFNVSKAHAKRLAVTETARIQTAVQKASYEANGFDEYEFMAEPSACPICSKLDGKIMKVADMEPGRNAAPMHPHCHCSTAPAVKRGRTPIVLEDTLESDIKKFKRRQYLPNIYDGLSDKQTFAETRKEYMQVTREKFSQGTPLGQQIFTQYADQSAIETLSEMGRVRYENGKVYLNMYRDLNDNRGAATGYFHEFGHQIDDKLGWKFMNDKKISDLLNEDLQNIDMNKFVIMINTDDKASSVSDILGALSGGDVQGKYYHDLSYWKKDRMLESEFFAHVFEAQFDEERRKILEKAFPESYNYVIEKLKGE